jgi:hypothetical protein
VIEHAKIEEVKKKRYSKAKRNLNCVTWFAHLFKTFDRNFLLSLSLQYFNGGMKAIMSLAYLSMFNNVYHLEPETVQYLSSMMGLPWTPKIVYGIFTDTFPLFGSRKRHYLIAMGLL